MSDPDFLQQCSEAVGALLQVVGSNLPRSDENEALFSSIQPVRERSVLPEWTEILLPHTSLVRYEWELELQQGDLSANARLHPDGYFQIEDFRVEQGINPPLLDPDTEDTFTLLKGYLQSPGACFRTEPMIQMLAFLEQAGGTAEFSIQLFLDKAALLRRLALPTDVTLLLYVSTQNFYERLQGKPYTHLDDLLLPAGKQEIVVLLGDSRGFARGDLNRLLGRPHWSELEHFQPATEARQSAQNAAEFRNDECTWEFSPSRLTPFHLFIKHNELEHSSLVEAWMFLSAQACTTFLGNRSRLEVRRLCSEFKGYRSIKVCVPGTDPQLDYNALFGLFKWAYENHSSDKLGIVRQVLAPQLIGAAEENFTILVKRSQSSREEAKNNFDDYLRDKVDDYFAKRIQVIEFLQKFSDETGASVSKLAGDLVGDLYKTVGVILGVVLAALVDPKITAPVIYWTSLLYMVYIFFITVYPLLSTYLRYVGKVHDYQFNIQKMSSLLSEAEIERIQGQPYKRAKWIFRVYFTLTEVAYLLLGGLAYLIMRAVAPFL